MAESKWEEEGSRGESKWSERDEREQKNQYEKKKNPSKNGGNYESKFNDDESDQADDSPEVTETALTVSSSVFGSDPIVGKLVEFWGTALSDDINSFFAENCFQFEPGA